MIFPSASVRIESSLELIIFFVLKLFLQRDDITREGDPGRRPQVWSSTRNQPLQYCDTNQSFQWPNIYNTAPRKGAGFCLENNSLNG